MDKTMADSLYAIIAQKEKARNLAAERLTAVAEELEKLEAELLTLNKTIEIITSIDNQIDNHNVEVRKKDEVTSFNKILSWYMTELGISGRALAIRINISPNLPSLWLNGKRLPSRKTLRKVIDFLKEVTSVNEQEMLDAYAYSKKLKVETLTI